MVRSTFPSQNVQNTSGSEHFWKFTCRKSARCCGVKHISKSKCAKHHLFGPLLDIPMSFRLAGARDSAPCQKRAKRHGCVAVSTTTTTTLHYTTPHHTTPHHTTLHYTTRYYTTLQLQLQLQLQLHEITRHYSTLVTLHYTTLNYTTRHYATPQHTRLHYTTLH